MTPKGRTRDLLTTADGRSVCSAQWGVLSGFPVFEWALEGEARLAPELEREFSELAEVCQRTGPC